MANSLEVRVPLLDHHVVELAATIPSDYKLAPLDDGRFDEKHLLKHCEEALPGGADQSPEDGVWGADGAWIQSGPEIETRLISSEHLARYFNVAAIRRRVTSTGVIRGCRLALWNLLFLDEWLRTHEAAIG